ncbi:MAG: hypothetical protein A2V21_305130 [Deltaproteobacteria bacterium GWC2_55_46]|nr:MAG: hypothetical protein A2Z79_08995 [Deltaproteobacteria bacterium GWA2_55_82]OGQ64603.1 MAG: hypothetical protein A3I81_11260 [Deltaproteobacteria bacterium RIFCSPLOWO2_02_FULL_55_12]OIJ73701.1 MAG: hypothetical protein A2V21_305130 [Deltaproteobacteria bacterium GWC2_55_46]
MNEATKTAAAAFFGSLSKVLSSRTGKTSIMVLTGSLVSALCGFIVNIAFAKQLGPANFGLLSATLVFMNICIQITDFGTGKSIVRLSSGNHDLGISKKEVYSTSLLFRLAASVAIALIVYLSADSVGTGLLKNPELAPYIRIACAGILIGGIGQTFLSILQEQEMFASYSADKVLTAVLKIVLVASIAWFFGLTVIYALWITVASIAAGAIFAYIIMPGGNFLWSAVSTGAFTKIFSYTRWVAIVQVSSILTMNLPILILSRYSVPDQVGLYSAALNIALGFGLVAESLAVVLLPRYSKESSLSELRLLNKKVTRLLAIFAVPAAAIILNADAIMGILYGGDYSKAGVILQVAVLAALINLSFISYSTLLYRVKRAYYVSIDAVLRLLMTIALGVVLVDMYDALGIAVAVLITRAAAAIYTFFVIRYSFRNEQVTG